MLSGVLGAALVAGTWAGVGPGNAAGPGHTVIPHPAPVTSTPAIGNGQVNAIAEIGSTGVAGGTFTTVTAPGGSAQNRPYVVAFDADTGALRTGFNPVLNGAVQDVQPGPTAGTVYLSGNFTTVNGTPQSHVTLLNVSNGAIVGGFRPASTNGVVNALTVAHGRLVLGGNFTVAGGAAHGGLATLNPTTGALDPLMGVDVTERHNDTGSGAQGAVGVRDLEATSDGDKVAVIGNFKRADGLQRDQLVVLDVTPTSAGVDPDWRTRRYEPYCFNWAFDTYVRGVAVSPDDSYFVVTSTGGHNGGTLCDTAARWEFAATGDAIQPTWIDYTGGDTLWSVEVTENAVYVGGHQRWMNNSDAGDSNGQGSVPRAGIAALDTDSGLPLSWNPGRNPRGAAAFALHASSRGLWVGSDTDWIGNYQYRRPRLARFRMTGGAPVASESTPRLPANVYLGGARGVSQGNVLHRVNAGGPALDGIDGGPAWIADDGGSDYRNSGSNAAGWGPGATVDGTVPASTPGGVFDSERWSPSDDPRMSWDFPAANQLPLQVRLYFANRCTCTSAAGSRVFDVDIDGTRVLDDFDIVSAVGDQRGTMRAFDITSDGRVDIDFSHVVENPLINAIEIVRRDLPPPAPPANDLRTVEFDGAEAGTPTDDGSRGIDWNAVRGAFLVGDTLFHANTDGYLYRRTFTAGSTGPATRIDPYNDPEWSNVTTGSGNTFRGRVPAFYGQISGLTGIYYADDRIYYTRSGSSQLSWRWFNADSGIVGSQEFNAGGGVNWSDSGGLFRDGDDLYVVSRSTGRLSRTTLVGGVPQGPLTLVDGSVDWRANAVFLGPDGGAPGNDSPTAAFTSSCNQLTCAFDSSGSSDPDGSVASRAWDFGDGETGSGTSPSHTYDAAGSYTVTLRVTDDGGATDETTRTVQVTEPAPSAIDHVVTASAAAHNLDPAVAIPGSVQGGDLMVLVGSYGINEAGVTDPAGWTRVARRQTVGFDSYVWTRRAAAGDAGGSVSTPVSDLSKSALVLAAYRGVAAGDPLAAVESAVDAGTTQHTSPTVSVPPGGWAMQVWTDKSSSTETWTAPAGVTTRTSVVGAGGGRVSALGADQAGASGGGTAGGLTAVTNAPSGRGTAWTIALRSAS